MKVGNPGDIGRLRLDTWTVVFTSRFGRPDAGVGGALGRQGIPSFGPHPLVRVEGKFKWGGGGGLLNLQQLSIHNFRTRLWIVLYLRLRHRPTG